MARSYHSPHPLASIYAATRAEGSRDRRRADRAGTRAVRAGADPEGIVWKGRAGNFFNHD